MLPHSFKNIRMYLISQLACILRCFLDLDFMKIVYRVDALYNCSCPKLHVLQRAQHTQSSYHAAFRQLSDDLLQTDPKRLLDSNTPAFSFVSKDRFRQTIYDNDICHEGSRRLLGWNHIDVEDNPAWTSLSFPNIYTYIHTWILNIYIALLQLQQKVSQRFAWKNKKKIYTLQSQWLE